MMDAKDLLADGYRRNIDELREKVKALELQNDRLQKQVDLYKNYPGVKALDDALRLIGEIEKLVQGYESYSIFQNPSQADQGWKACARAITEKLRVLKQPEKRDDGIKTADNPGTVGNLVHCCCGKCGATQ